MQRTTRPPLQRRPSAVGCGAAGPNSYSATTDHRRGEILRSSIYGDVINRTSASEERQMWRMVRSADLANGERKRAIQRAAALSDLLSWRLTFPRASTTHGSEIGRRKTRRRAGPDSRGAPQPQLCCVCCYHVVARATDPSGVAIDSREATAETWPPQFATWRSLLPATRMARPGDEVCPFNHESHPCSTPVARRGPSSRAAAWQAIHAASP